MKKIIIGITLLFLILGIAYATDINNLKCPGTWESAGNGMYLEVGPGHGLSNGRNMAVMNYTSSIHDEFFNNVTDEDYYVYKGDNNTYNYTDLTMNHDEGCFEVVEIDGKQYLLMFTSNTKNQYTSQDMGVYESMIQFNKLNNLKPIAV